MTTWRSFVLLGALNGFLGVALGAFGAHGLEGTLDPELLRVWNKAVDYQQLHALGLLLVGVLLRFENCRRIRLAGWCLLIGVLLFSGSLYALALSGIRPLGAVTPFGGVSFLLGWGLLALGVIAPPEKATANRRRNS
ncbi:MAG TPA: DUF423 domain-containing protein [Geothermobacteraceae bacterium]|nr:DUF423 domain-containing protein [Geothermobacteraceae bacterium]